MPETSVSFWLRSLNGKIVESNRNELEEIVLGRTPVAARTERYRDISGQSLLVFLFQRIRGFLCFPAPLKVLVRRFRCPIQSTAVVSF